MGNLYTEEAYVYFQRLQFKNLLARFDVKTENALEDSFRIVKKKTDAETVLEQARKAPKVGVALYKDTTNVLPLFVQMAGMDGAAIAFGDGKVYCISATDEIEIGWILKELEETAGQVAVYAVFNLKEHMSHVKIEKEEVGFDATVAAYLLNPLKSDYTYTDVAQEHLNLLIDEKASAETKACYEAYTAYQA